MKKIYVLMLTLTLLISNNANAVDESLESVTSRGVTHKFILTKPDEAPTASIILLAGGHGKLSLGSFFGVPTIAWGDKNNLVRTRKNYAKHGFLVATLDAPENKGKMNAIWRMSNEHAADISAVVNFLKQNADLPVWVIGTSMGSFSAANAGIELSHEIGGIILTSSITQSKPKWKIYLDFPNGVINMSLSKITVPVLVVSHEDDGCALTPASDIDKLTAKFSNSSKVEKAVVSGGDAPISGPCKALSEHGFLGIEQMVVDLIARFIKEN